MRDIWKMLDDCAPGWTKSKTKHHFRVRFQGQTYYNLPAGQHGKKPGRAEVQKKHVKDLVETLGIQDCAKDSLEILRK